MLPTCVLMQIGQANKFFSEFYQPLSVRRYFFVAPFASLIGAPAAGGMVLEISSIIAMIVYFLIAWVLERIVYVLFYRPRGPVSVRQTSVSDHTPQ